MAELAVFDKDPNIYLFTSLTAGSSHIITATSRIETILRANKIPFIGLDTATHELGKKLFQRRASGKKLPLLVKEGYVLGGIEEIEEWNEYDELREALGVDSQFTANPAKPTSLFEPAPSKTPPPLAAALPGGFSFASSAGPTVREKAPVASSEQNLAIRQLGAEAAKIAASKKPTLTNISTTNPLLAEKTNAKSPADVLSPKSTPLPKSPNPTTTEKTDGEGKKLLSVELPSLLSPRSIPLPPTPGTVPKPGEQKPVHLPPSMHDDAANPALSAGPIKVTQKHEASPEHKEESSAEDTSAKSVPQKTQDQDPKDASKSGASVKEGEQEEKSNEEEESSEESSAEASAEETKEVETKKVETEGASQKAVPKQSSSEETSEEEEEEEEEESEEEKKEKDTKEVKKTQAQDPKDISKAGESVLD